MNAGNAVTEIDAAGALARQRAGSILVDVRDPNEWALGTPVGALKISLGEVAQRLSQELAERDVEILTICASGTRSMRAAQALAERGFSRAVSVRGGVIAWQAARLPWDAPDSLDADARERYSRHLLLPEIGIAGQQLLRRSRVVVVGAGGLGSPAALYLAAAGVGKLRIIDDDRVERSNLQRQVLHSDPRVGTPKVESAQATLGALNPTVTIEAVQARLVAANVEQHLSDADVVVDGSDNFPTRYLVNDACVALGKPLVYGAVQRFEGQVGVFWPGHASGSVACYRCLFPEPPRAEDAPNCAQAGVLGVVPGIIGLLQANEAIKLLLGIGTPLLGRLLMFDALGTRFRELALPRDPNCPACGPNAKRGVYVEYDAVCAT
jgi:molybdopterin/thiamine biosynthesis adenylyltransferase